MSDKSEFFKVIKDFTVDILRTFPEYKENLHIGLKNILEGEIDTVHGEFIYEYCRKIYPSQFFNILYQNEETFKDETPENIFLPGISFYKIWKEDISDKTRTIIWKYLQLILFSIVNSERDGGDFFGDTAKLFEEIDESEFKNKLEESINQISEMFDVSNVPLDGLNSSDLPNPDELHSHISGLLGGNLGKLAREIAEETVNEMNLDGEEDLSSVGDLFKNLFKSPGKLMGLVKKVGGKLDAKLKKGDIKESELMKEASELMSKMKSMPGMKNMQKMMANMGMPLGKNAKMNMGAFQNMMNTNLRQTKMKEKMRERLKQKQVMEAMMKQMKPAVVEKTPREKKKKKRRRKKKKNKK
jgi:hypothetical protein